MAANPGPNSTDSDDVRNRWVFTAEQLADTPSKKFGIDGEKESNYRQQAASLIQDMGQKLQV
jgi:cyclin T